MKKLMRGLPLYISRDVMTIPTARHPPHLLLYSYSAMRTPPCAYAHITPKKKTQAVKPAS